MHVCDSTSTIVDFTSANSQDKTDLDDAERTFQIIKRLKDWVGQIFPYKDFNSELTIVSLSRLSMHYSKYVMVDHDGKLTIIVYWKCVSAVPL